MTILSQRDPRWANVKLGSKGLITIGAYGCTTTALAEVNNEFGASCTPQQVAEHLDWYTPEGLVLWTKLNMQKAAFEPNGRVYGYNPQRVKESIKNSDKSCLLEVKLGHGKHWLKGESITVIGRIMARDPWTGKIVDVVRQYGPITGSAHFTRR